MKTSYMALECGFLHPVNEKVIGKMKNEHEG